MKTLSLNCKTARNLLLKSAVAALAATLSLAAIAQPTPPTPAEIEEMLEYSQCIRANGYAEFPDPGADGRLMIRITDPVAGEQFRAAQGACTDKLPSRMAAMNAPMTPERLEGLVKFAECVRATGMSDFPDPTPEGVFEISSPTINLQTPQAQQTMNTCREANGVTGMMIRRLPPR
jgi:hypothetical protein